MYRVIEFIIDVIAWLRIAISPLAIGVIVGAAIYFSSPNTTTLILGVFFAIFGLIFGIIWATKIWKKKGSIEFLSKAMATPELESLDATEKKNE